MPTNKPTTVYRKIFANSFKQILKHKTLWVFGIFAGLISTGGVVDIAISSLQRVNKTGTLLDQLMDRSFFGYTLFAQYIEQLLTLGPSRSTLILIMFVALFILLTFAGVYSQTVLILTAENKKIKHRELVFKKAPKYFIRILTIDILAKTLMTVLTVVFSLPVLLYIIKTSVFSFSLMFLQTLLFIPLIILINILAMITMIHIVDHGSSIVNALHVALKVIHKQWLAAFEFGLLLFSIVLFSGITLLLASTLLLIPYALIYSAALFTGSYQIFLAANVIFGILFLVIIVAFAGGIVSFQYNAWYRFYQHAIHKNYANIAFSKLLRIFRS